MSLDANKLLENFDCSRGAPMGRQSILINLESKVQAFKVRIYDGCYDMGGAYWGMGVPLYAAIGDDFQAFTRSNSRKEAVKDFASRFPNLKFYKK